MGRGMDSLGFRPQRTEGLGLDEARNCPRVFTVEGSPLVCLPFPPLSFFGQAQSQPAGVQTSGLCSQGRGRGGRHWAAGPPVQH